MRRFLLPLVLVLTLGLAACGGGDDDTSADAGDDTAGGGTSTIQVMGTNDLKFDPTELSAAPGEVTVELECGDAVNHDFMVEEAGDAQVAACEPGETSTGTITLEAGTYTFYCSVPGHRAAGMEGTLTVG